MVTVTKTEKLRNVISAKPHV